MNKLLGLMAVAGLMAVSIPAERAQALSLSNPAAAAAAEAASKTLTTDVRWRRHRGFRRHHGFRHRFHRHRRFY